MMGKEKERIRRFVERHQLFGPTDKLLVALSGGADSVALLCLLSEEGIPCEALHCNFHLRGEESDRDEAFVRNLCAHRGVRLHVTHFETERIAKERHLSVEMAARELRYTWFEEMRQQCHATAIAVAHHRDDSIETLLLNLIRGTGIQGLRGIKPRNGFVVRPLLCLSREELTAYLQRIGQPYVTDSTNLTDTYTRNKIRLRLLPLLEEFNPSIRETLQTTAHLLDEAGAVYDHGIEEGKKRIVKEGRIDLHLLRQEPSAEALLYEILSPKGFTPAQVADILNPASQESGRQFLTPAWRVVTHRNLLEVEPRTDVAVPPALHQEKVLYTPDFPIPRRRDQACMDAAKLKHPLQLRLWKRGDWFVPFGMKGRKLVSDFLTDLKLSLTEKERQWVLCCGPDICWVVGQRIDNRFRIDAQTKEVLLLSIAPAEGIKPDADCDRHLSEER